MASMSMCATPNCNSAAKLQCPTCLKQGIGEGSFFCSQDCFKSSWSTHKAIHAKKKEVLIQDGIISSSGVGAVFDPFNFKYNYTGKLRACYPLSEKRTLPPQIRRPDYADHMEGKPLSELAIRGSSNIRTLSEEEMDGMRVAGKLSRQVLDAAMAAVAPGVTTDEIDRVVHEMCVDLEVYPSPLNYYQFPKSCCTSVNEVICHGIPDQRKLEKEDIVNVDVTVFTKDGFHGDLNETVCVDKNSANEEAQRLIQTTWECLQKAIEMVKPGTKYRDVGNIIQKHAQSQGFSVVRSYCGHGIHNLFHCAPSVPHYAKNKAIGVMKPGHCFTIEPMINAGNWRDEQWPDNWTAVTVDGKLSAQFEETLLVVENGVEIVTRRSTPRPYFLD